MNDRDDIVRRIRHAFRDVPRPETERDLTDGGIEAPYVVEHFLGRSRAEIDRGYLLPSLHMEDFTYMTPGAAAYYLPPVLELMLLEPFDAELWTFLRGSLASPINQRTWALSAPQREAIADWADFLARAWDLTREIDPRPATKLARLYREGPGEFPT